MKRKDNAPFYWWVPKPVGCLIYIFMFLPVLCTNGAYSNNAGEMTAALGIISENIQFSYFATAIGMVVFIPFSMIFLKIGRMKVVYLGGLTLMIFLSSLCAQTDSMFLLFFCSFLMGFLRSILLFNTLFGLIDYATETDFSGMMFSEDNDAAAIEEMNERRKLTMPFLYLFLIVVTQLGSALTSWLAFTYKWQYVYSCMSAIVLTAVFLTLVTMKFQKRKPFPPIHFPRWGGDMVALSLMLLSFCFILIYGKTFDWFDSFLIGIALIVFVISCGLFLILIITGKAPFVDLRAIRLRQVWVSLLLFVLIMVLNASSILVTVFSGISMNLDNLQSANLGNYSIIGYVIGAVVAFLMVKKQVHFKYIFAMGFLLMTLSAMYMYFQFQTENIYGNLIFPTIIRSAGMIIIYAMCAAYGMLNLPVKYMTSWICLMLVFRSVVGPVIGSSLYTNVLYERQNYYIERLSHNVDMLNPEISASYTRTQIGAMMQGASVEDAEILSTMQLKGRIQIQATLAALKKIAGWTVYAGVGCVLLMFLLPYRKTEKEETIIGKIPHREAGTTYPAIS